MVGSADSRYDKYAYESESGQYLDFIIDISDEIPTLTEWGIIIFCVLLFGWMAWVIVRRRRRVTIGV